MAKQITFEYEGKEYILEFNKETFKKTTEAGFPYSRIDELQNNPADAIDVLPELWFRSFQMHHPSMTRDKAEEIYHTMDNKGGDFENDFGLVQSLLEMYSEPIEILYTEPGNTKWSKSWK